MDRVARYIAQVLKDNGHQLYVGSEGGCYYINKNDNKTYVDRSYCSNCN